MDENGQESSLSDSEAVRSSLRQRWELASVLNFFKVFEPVIESNLKISAEEIETALILPNKFLAQIHISLLKGIPPVSKNLKDPDAWVVSLSKKLTMWWPWVAKGDFPLTSDKGAEMATYKELDPTIRLVILKALCEIRADQHDVVSYINEGVKLKNEMPTFRKVSIAEDGKGTSYWYDGDEVIGFRLYKEVNTFKKNGAETVKCQWETLATNLEEFQKVVDEYSSSRSKLEVAVTAAVESEVMPVLNKLEKKKQKALQKKMREEKIMNNFCRVGVTRSCRRSKAISYTFDDYDKAINEAIRETKKMKSKDEQKSQKKATVVKEDSEQDDDDNDSDNESTESDSENHNDSDGNNDVSESSNEDSGEEPHETSNNEENTDEEEEEEEEESNGNHSSEDEVVKESESENGGFVGKTRGSKRVSESDDEMRNFGAKKRLRQRPNRNSAIESAIVSDTEDESCSSGNSDS